MPYVISHKLVEKDQINNTKIYKEVYREGRREERYFIIEKTLEVEDYKEKSLNFTIANMIECEGKFVLNKVNDYKTQFTYSGDNKEKKLSISVLCFSGKDNKYLSKIQV